MSFMKGVAGRAWRCGSCASICGSDALATVNADI